MLKTLEEFSDIKHHPWKLILRRNKTVRVDYEGSYSYSSIEMFDPIPCAGYNISEEDTIEIHLKEE